MKYGKFLDMGGTIGFVAPSFGCATEPYRTAFDHALNHFRELGYRTELGANCYADQGIGISNTPQKCAEELMNMYLATDTDVLISCGGGELMCEDLDYLDFEELSCVTPKWYMGFSDNTNFTFLLTTICDVASIYGPCASAFGMEPWHDSIGHAFNLLNGKRVKAGSVTQKGYICWEKESEKDEKRPLAAYNTTEKRVTRAYQANGEIASEETVIQMRGRLTGGCLDCLALYPGTRFDHVEDFARRYQEDGILWFLESCDLNVMSIRRTLWQLEHAGWFQHVKGFLIGRPMHFDEPEMGLDQYEAVLGVLRKYRVPIIMDLDIGHLPPMMPLINGSVATVQSKGNDFSIQMDMCE